MYLLKPEDFESWVGRKVRINTLPASIEVTLDRIERRPAFAAGLDFREPFSLFFTSPMDVYLLDATYEFDCGRGGPHNILITQLAPLRNMRNYQAVFA